MWPRDSLKKYSASGQFFFRPAHQRLVQWNCTSIMTCEFDGTSALSCATSAGRLSIVGSGGGPRRPCACAAGGCCADTLGITRLSHPRSSPTPITTPQTNKELNKNIFDMGE